MGNPLFFRKSGDKEKGFSCSLFPSLVNVPAVGEWNPSRLITFQERPVFPEATYQLSCVPRIYIAGEMREKTGA